MTIPNNTIKVSYAGDGTIKDLDFNFKIWEDDDVLVIKEVDATGVQTVLTLDSDYTVTIDADFGGTVTPITATIVGNTYHVICNVDNLQETDFTEGDKFPVASIETALDKLTMQTIQLKDAVDRAIKIPVIESTDQTLEEVAENRAKKALVFDDDGNISISTDDYEDQVANVAAQVALATAQAVLATTQAENAETSATNAETSATNAETAETNAEASAVDAAASAAKLKGTSTSSVAIGTGSKSFTTQAGKQFDVGTWLLIASDADETNYMHGQVTTYSGTSLTVNVTNVGGSGTHTDWIITVAGTRGATGASGATGATGASMPIADAGGTVDAITADFTPDLTLADKTLVAVVSAGANTSATPTFAPDGLPAHTIVKEGGQALIAGDIGAAGFVMILEYNLANTRWELLNPTSISCFKKVGGSLSGALNFNQVSIAADTTTDILGAGANSVALTGNSPITITSLGTSTQAGAIRHVVSTGSGEHILTHNATSLILPTAANITVKQGDSWFVKDLGSNNARVFGYQRADGTALTDWTVITAFTATPASTSTLTMTSDLTASILVGYGLKYVIGGVTYYGKVSAITSNLLTVHGAPLGGDVTALYYTDKGITQVTYDNSASTSVLTTGTPWTLTWNKPKAYLVEYSVYQVVHDSGTHGKATCKINATEVNTSAGGLTVAANTTWYTTVVDIATAAYDINPGEDLTIYVTQGSTVDGYGLKVNAVFVEP